MTAKFNRPYTQRSIEPNQSNRNNSGASKWKKWLRNNKSNLIFGFAILLLILTILAINCSLGSYNEAAVKAFSKYTTKNDIIYSSYDCGNRPNRNGMIICTYNFIDSKNEKVISTLMCDCNRIFGSNTCYPVDRIW